MMPVETLREWVRRAWGTFRGAPSDGDLERELRLHLEMAEEELRRRGHSADAASQLARRRFGAVPRALQALHDQRGLPWLGQFSLDFRLALRRLRKSWGMTVIGGLAMTIAIAIAAGAFSFVQALSGGPLPLDEGDRVVAVRLFSEADTGWRNPTPEDLERWRNDLRSVEDVGAFRTVSRRLVLSGDASGAAQDGGGIIRVAEMSAAGFRLARVPPLRGRPLVEEDEHAERVLVIGYDAWRLRFSADPGIVGRQVWLDGVAHTIVGVMPPDFAFPINHEYWVPLRTASSDLRWDQGPEIIVFGRLASGATLESAQAELTALGVATRPAGTASADEPVTLDPRITPYAKAFIHIESGWSELFIVLFTFLLVPPCANIAILVYARTVVRQEEFATRIALGASRGRIVLQLFIEMLVLSAAAASTALLIVHLLLVRTTIGVRQSPGGSPFWMDLGISTGLTAYAVALAVLGATIAGIVPAIQATGSMMQSGLRTFGGGGRLRLGKVWSAMIVTQVAFAVLVLPSAAELGWGLLRPSFADPGFRVEAYMTVRVHLSGGSYGDAGVDSSQASSERFAEVQSELLRRLEAEPGIGAVAVSQIAPGAEPSRQAFLLERAEGTARVDENRRADSNDGFAVAVNRVASGFFEAFDLPLLAGRGFGADDFETRRNTAVVNRTLAEQIAGDEGGALGRRIRNRNARPESEAWYEIVGVVADLPANDQTPRIYLPMTPGQTQQVALTFRVFPGAEGVAGRVQEITRFLDPALVVDEILPLDVLYEKRRVESLSGVAALTAATLSVLLLSAAGMYAMMSFTLNQRRREIGIRSALGAPSDRLLGGIFRRSLAQIGGGVTAGLIAAAVSSHLIPIEELGGRDVPGVLFAAAILMLVIGTLAVAGPARRALSLAPTEALRDG